MHEPHRIADDTSAAGRMDPVLYSFRRCPYAMRARLAIAVSRTDVVLREVKLSAKPEAMLAASPKGTVPVLVLPDGKVIDESLGIMRWALAKQDPECWLEGDDAALIDRNDGPFKHDLDRYKYPERYGVDPLKHRATGMEFLQELDDRLGRTSQLCGPVRSLADAAIMPFVRQFAGVDQAWFSDQSLDHLKVWLANHISSELFDLIMLRVAPWSPADRPVRLTQVSMCQQPAAVIGKPTCGDECPL
jgi:glutathione S-transferase